MKSFVALPKARAFTKKLLGWQYYQSYLVAEAAKDNLPLLRGATTVIATSWTTLEAAITIGDNCRSSIYWVPLSNRVVWRNKLSAFVSANRKKGRRNFAALAQRLGPSVAKIHETCLINKHPDSPRDNIVRSLGVTTDQIRRVSTINDASKSLSTLQGRVLCLVDSVILPGGGIHRLLKLLRKNIPGLEVITIASGTDTASITAAIALGFYSPVWSLEQYDERYSWATALKLLLSRYRRRNKKSISPVKQPVRDTARIVYKRQAPSARIKWERKFVDFFRKRNFTTLLKIYFRVRASHFLEDEIRIFRSNLKKVAAGRRFDIVQSIDLISAPAGADLAQVANACHIVDINEFVYLEPRVGWQFQTMSRRNFFRIYRQIQIALGLSSGVISNSAGGARLTLHKYGTRALPVRNLRDPVQISEIPTSIRIDFSMPEDAIVIIHVCTISPAYKSDIAIHVLRYLPSNYHLVFVGYGNSTVYLKKIDLLIAKLGLTGRVHFRSEIADEQEYISYVATADIGLVTLDIESPFVRFNLPNRVCDLLAARLPMVSSYSYEVKHIFKETRTGFVVKSNDPKAFAASIKLKYENMLADQHEMSRALAAAAANYTWNSEITSYFNYVYSLRDKARVRTVAFVFQRGLVRNRRVLRFADQYVARGCKVTIFCGAMPPKEVREAYPAIRFLHVPARYHLEVR